jgi:hypothetical protein
LNVAKGRPPLPTPRSSRDRARSSIEPVVLRRSGYRRGNSFEQNNPIGAPRLVIAAESPSVQIAGYLRIAADQRWLQTVIRFQAGHRAKR